MEPESKEFLSSPYSIFKDVLRPTSPLTPPSSSVTYSSVATTNSAISIPPNLHLCPDAAIEQLVARYGAVALVRQLAAEVAERDERNAKVERMSAVLTGMLCEHVSPDEIDARLAEVEDEDEAEEPGIVPEPDMESSQSSESLESSVDGSTGHVISFRRTALQHKREEHERELEKNERTVRKAKSFRLPFFWKSEDDMESEASTAPARKRPPFAVPLFPEDKTLPPVITSERPKNAIRDNVNNFFKSMTETSVKSANKRKQQIVAPERNPAESDPIEDDTSSFKSAVQSQPDDDSPRSEITSPLFPTKRLDPRATAFESRANDAPRIMTVPSFREKAMTYDYDYEEEDRPRGFGVSFRNRSRSRSRSRASRTSHLSQNLHEWLPHSVTTAAASADHGPVELENIVPQSIQPPTLLQSWNAHYRSEDTFLLTDRFGFIYDRQHPPVLPPAENHKLNLDSLDFFFDHAEFSEDEKDAVPHEKDEENTLGSVKTLLAQLTELHDSLQRAQKSRWDDFLRKINSDGSDDAPLAIENGELFGMQGRILKSSKQSGRSRFKEFKALVLGGIPVVYRSKIWGECCGADSLRVPGVYEELVASEHDPEAMAQIQLDLYRTMPSNVFFGGKGPGVMKLRRVLLAFSKRNAQIGYCQGMNMIAATLLLTHATEEDAFWSFVALIENILPSGYFDPPLLTSRADQRVLKQYLHELQPKLFDHLVGLEVDIEAITFNWFLSCFTDCLSAEVLFRIWDVFMCIEGEAYLFRVALSLFSLSSRSLLQLKSAAEAYSYMKDMASHAISIEGLIRLADSLRHQVRIEDVVARRKMVIADLEDMGF